MLVELTAIRGKCPYCVGVKGAEGEKEIHQVRAKHGFNGLACPQHLYVIVAQHKEPDDDDAHAEDNGSPLFAGAR